MVATAAVMGGFEMTTLPAPLAELKAKWEKEYEFVNADESEIEIWHEMWADLAAAWSRQMAMEPIDESPKITHIDWEGEWLKLRKELKELRGEV